MTKFEDELREAVKYAKSKYWLCELTNDEIEPLYKAASLLLDILPELRGLVEARAAVVCAEMEVRTYENYPNGYAVYEAIPGMGYCFAEKWEERATADRIENLRAFGKFSATAANSTTTLTEKLKKAGVV